jgi:hypothetical protein
MVIRQERPSAAQKPEAAPEQRRQHQEHRQGRAVGSLAVLGFGLLTLLRANH